MGMDRRGCDGRQNNAGRNSCQTNIDTHQHKTRKHAAIAGMPTWGRCVRVRALGSRHASMHGKRQILSERGSPTACKFRRGKVHPSTPECADATAQIQVTGPSRPASLLQQIFSRNCGQTSRTPSYPLADAGRCGLLPKSAFPQLRLAACAAPAGWLRRQPCLTSQALRAILPC